MEIVIHSFSNLEWGGIKKFTPNLKRVWLDIHTYLLYIYLLNITVGTGPTRDVCYHSVKHEAEMSSCLKTSLGFSLERTASHQSQVGEIEFQSFFVLQKDFLITPIMCSVRVLLLFPGRGVGGPLGEVNFGNIRRGALDMSSKCAFSGGYTTCYFIYFLCLYLLL